MVVLRNADQECVLAESLARWSGLGGGGISSLPRTGDPETEPGDNDDRGHTRETEDEMVAAHWHWLLSMMDLSTPEQEATEATESRHYLCFLCCLLFNARRPACSRLLNFL